MKALAKLKDEARKHEAKEEWEKAISSYVQVINSAEGAEGDQELPLYNRVGDLYVRLGKPADAVTFYERAADHYAEAGLYNNAIALCNKALRYVPNRLELLRKLGQFSAAQGFITDARRWYLEYAERQIKAGHLDDAFKALEDFADVHEDVEIREMLGHQLKAHARDDKAVSALQRAYSLRMQAGEHQAAERLKNEILALNPNATISADAAPARRAPAPPPEQVGWEQPGAAFVDLPPAAELGLESAAGAAFGAAIPTEPPPGLVDLPGLDVPPPAEEPGPIDLSTTDFGSVGGALDLDAGLIDLEAPGSLEPLPGLDAELPLLEEEPPVELPMLDTGMDDLPGIEVEAVAPETAELPLEHFEEEEEEPTPLPMMDFGEPSAPEPLPTIDFGQERPVAEPPPPPPTREVEPPVMEAAAPALEEPEIEARPVIEPEAEVTAQAVPEIQHIPAPEPEVAAPEPPKPEIPKAQVPKPEAPKPEAKRAEPPPAAAMETKPAAPPPAKKRAGEYVDLSSFLEEDEDDRKSSSRFVVAEKPPTGDEERDFADMLSQFKQKVSENISIDDAAAHYDLGLAFKEMGLIDEAIGEFQTAMQGGEERLKVYEELGQCFLLKQQYTVALNVLNRALQVPVSDERDLIGVYYSLARSYEELGQREEAKVAYERVVGLDINFQDATQRLAKL